MEYTRKRIYGTVPQYSTDELKVIFEKLSYIKIALLFGSRVDNKNHAKSDYDFALLMEQLPSETWGMQARAFADLTQLLNLAAHDLDIVDLSQKNDLIYANIKEHYIVLKGDPNEISGILG